jgi:nitrite transporter NirC
MLFSSELGSVAEAAVKKKELLSRSWLRYLIAAFLAGMFVGFGVLLMSVIGGTLSSINIPAVKLINGAAFSVALSLVIMAGGELFTGNNLVMAVGALEKKVTWGDCTRVWAMAFIGNLIGSVALAAVFKATGLINDGVQAFILNSSTAKMSLTLPQLLTRGVLCNILVCIAVWCSIKLKSESGKLIMVFWCIFAFVTCGFEHSVANMTMLSLSLMLPSYAGVSFGGMIYNLLFVTIGNILGGAAVGGAYWFIGRKNELD